MKWAWGTAIPIFLQGLLFSLVVVELFSERRWSCLHIQQHFPSIHSRVKLRGNNRSFPDLFSAASAVVKSLLHTRSEVGPFYFPRERDTSALGLLGRWFHVKLLKTEAPNIAVSGVVLPQVRAQWVLWTSGFGRHQQSHSRNSQRSSIPMFLLYQTLSSDDERDRGRSIFML